MQVTITIPDTIEVAARKQSVTLDLTKVPANKLAGALVLGARQKLVNFAASALQSAAIAAIGNWMKKDVSFYEVYGKVNYTFNDNFSLGANVFYSPNFLNFGTEGTYASVVGKVIAPSSWYGSSGIGSYLSGEFGRQWLGNTDAFYGPVRLADYNTWNVGLGFTYNVFTLDLRYTDTNLNKVECNAITSDFTASINSNGFGESKWCSARFTAKLSADVTLQNNIK